MFCSPRGLYWDVGGGDKNLFSFYIRVQWIDQEVDLRVELNPLRFLIFKRLNDFIPQNKKFLPVSFCKVLFL